MPVILNDSPAYRPSPAANSFVPPHPPIDSRTRPAAPRPVANATPHASLSLEQQRDAAEASALAASLDASGRFQREGLTFGDFSRLALPRLRELEARGAAPRLTGNGFLVPRVSYAANKALADVFINHRVQHEAG